MMPRIVLKSVHTQRHIASYGLAVQAKDTQRWLLVRHAMTPNFATLVSGYYRMSELKTILEHITPEESHRFKTLCEIEQKDQRSSHFTDLYRTYFPVPSTWLPSQGKEGVFSKEEIAFSFFRFERERLVLKELLSKVVAQGSANWSWPKGRVGRNEDVFKAACREFQEETGIVSTHVTIVSPHPLDSRYVSNNHRIYETVLWVGTLEKEVLLESTSMPHEIAERKWFSEEEIVHLFSSTPSNNCSHPSRLEQFFASKAVLETRT